MLYFAYGSNLNPLQMRMRCPRAERYLRAELHDHRLVFGGFSHRWGGAVASVVRAPGERVSGLLYTIDEEDLAVLDALEGHPFAYQRVHRVVVDEHCQRRRVHVYMQPEEGFESWEPAEGYVAVISRAYAHLGFNRLQLAAAVRRAS